MASLYEFLDELDDSPADLYKIHTGHHVHDGCSDKGDESPERRHSIDLDDDNFRPPLYPYEELIANLVEYNGSSGSEQEDIEDESQRKEKTPESIANDLARLITKNRCFVCGESNTTKHYNQTGHFKGIRNWIDKKLSKVKQTVATELLFCQACNLPLAGNEEARSHYSEASHTENLNSFCMTCLRVIDAADMADHCKSRRHLENEVSQSVIPTVKPLLVNSNSDPWFAEGPKRERRRKGSQASFASVKSSTSRTSSSTTLRTYASIVTGKLPKPNESLPAPVESSGVETEAVRDKQLEMHTNNDDCDILATKDINFTTNDSLPKQNNHCASSDIVTATSPEEQSVDERQPNVEEKDIAIDEGKKKLRKRRRKRGKHGTNSDELASLTDEGAARSHDDGLIYLDDVEDMPDEMLQAKLATLWFLQSNIESKTPEEKHHTMSIILLRLMTYNYCHICNEPVNRRVTGNHYKQKVHLKTLSDYITSETIYWGFSMENIGNVLCLPCHEVFGTIELARFHYESEKHARYSKHFCYVCLVHDSSDIHKDHKRNAEIEQKIENNEQNSPGTKGKHKKQPGAWGDRTKSAITSPDDVNSLIDSKSVNASTEVPTPSDIDHSQKINGKDEPTEKENIAPRSSNNERKPLKSPDFERKPSALKTHNFAAMTNGWSLPKPTLKHSTENTNFNNQRHQQLDCSAKKRTAFGLSNSITEEMRHTNQILQFKLILNELYGNPRTDVSTIHIRSFIMYIRHFRKLFELRLHGGADFKTDRVFEWSEANFPNRPLALPCQFVDEFYIFKLTLHYECDRLCNLAREHLTTSSDTILDYFCEFNEQLLLVLGECKMVNQLFSLIDKREVVENFMFDNDYLRDSNVEDLLLYFERRSVTNEIIKTLTQIVNKFFVYSSTEFNLFNVVQVRTLIMYMRNFKNIFGSHTRVFDIDVVFGWTEEHYPVNLDDTDDLEDYKRIIYQEVDDLWQVASKQRSVSCEDLFNYFAQFNWKILVILKGYDIVNGGSHLNKILKDDFERSKLAKEITIFKLTLNEFLGNRQTDLALIRVRNLIIYVRNLETAILNRFETREEFDQQTIFRPTHAQCPHKPLIINTLKLSNEYDIYKLTLFQVIDRICKLANDEYVRNFEILIRCFSKFNNKLLLILKDLDLSTCIVNLDFDDNLPYESAEECVCPNMCCSIKLER